MPITVAILKAAGVTANQIVRILELEQEERLLHQRERKRINKQNQRSRHRFAGDSQIHEQNQHSSHQCRGDIGDTTQIPEQNQRPCHQKNGDNEQYILEIESISKKDSRDSTIFRKKRANFGDWPKDFKERFWAVYPRKTGKGGALRKLDTIRRRGDVKFVDLMDGLKRFVDSKPDPQYTKHPETWLNKGCWDDGLSTQTNENGLFDHKPVGFYAKFCSPEMDAWQSYGKSIGRSYPKDRDGGWYFPTRWPPSGPPESPPQSPPAHSQGNGIRRPEASEADFGSLLGLGH